MSFSLKNIVDEIATDHKTEIDIWDKLVHYFTEYWDGDEHTFKQVLLLSRRQLGENFHIITDTSAYFTALENSFSDKNDLLEFLINLTGYLNYHTEFGSVNVNKHLKDCRVNLGRVQRECIKRGIFRDINFVGREKQIAQMKKEINHKNSKGILVCGLGGMGKTCLVHTVCHELRSDKWKTVKIELREQRSFKHFLLTTMNTFRELRGSSVGKVSSIDSNDENEKEDGILDEENILQQKLLDYIKKLRIEDTLIQKRILMFDNIDDVTTNPVEKAKLLAFFTTLLEMIESRRNCTMNIIITSRENFLLTPGCNSQLKCFLVKVEVTSLGRKNSLKLANMLTKQSNLDIKQINTIVQSCVGCPLALRVVCASINMQNSPYTCNIGPLNKPLTERTESLSISILSMTECLNHPYENLGEHKYTLCKLSLFRTAKFNLRSASIIVQTDQEISVKNQNKSLWDLKATLLLFKSRHLIEVHNEDNEAKDENCTAILQNESDDLMAYQEIFSLHPLVYKFLKEKEHYPDVARAMKEAKYNYIQFFDELVLNIGQEYDTNVLTAREKSNKLKVPIETYMQLMENYSDISDLENLQSFKTIEDTKQRNIVAMMILKPEEHLSYIRIMISKQWPNPMIKVSWEVEHMAAMIRCEKTSTNIVDKCRDILNTINDFRTDNLSDVEKLQLFNLQGRMNYYCGLLAMETDSKECETFLKKAETIFKSKEFWRRNEQKKYLSDIYNCLGCVYYRQNETERAIIFHKKALNNLRTSHIQNENTVTFNSNIGACHFRIGIQHLRDKEKEMKKALTFYNNSISEAEALKMDRTDIYLRILKNRGDVLTMLRQYKEAKKDYQECLDIVNTLYISPSRNEILILHAQGDLIRKIVASKSSFESSDVIGEERNQEEMYNLTEEGLEIYAKLKNMLNSDIFPADHESFNKIKKNHLYFLKQQHETLEDTEQFYSAYMRRSLDDDTDSSGSAKSSSTDSIEGCGDDNEQNPHDQILSISPLHSEIKDEGASHETKIHGSIVDRIWLMEKKQQFKLPLHTTDVEKTSLGQFRESHPSSHGSSFEDDVFPKAKTENSDSKDAKTDQREVKRRFSPFSSVGSTSFEKSTVIDEEAIQKEKKRKIETTFGAAASFDKTLSPARSLEKRKLEDLTIKKKLPPPCKDKRKDSSSQTDSRNIDSIVDELEDLIPSVQPRMRSLIRDIDSRKARLVDDIKGRPTIQYKDEGFSDETGS